MSNLNPRENNLFQNNQVEVLLQKCYNDPEYHNAIYKSSINKHIILNLNNIQKYVNNMDDIINDVQWWCSIFNTDKVICCSVVVYNKIKQIDHIKIVR